MEIPHEFRSPTGPGGPGGPINPNKEPDSNNHEIEDALANRMYYRTESLSSELIASAENPHELFTGLRSLEKMLEDGNIPQSLSERYTPPRELSLMYERASVLGIPIDDLIKQGLIKDYNQNTGEGTPKKRKFASLALRVDENPIYLTDKDGNYVTDNEGRKREVGVNLKYVFGTPEKRVEMAKAYEKAVLELEVRDIMGDHIGLRLNLDFRDNLEGLTEMLHGGRMPKFRADHVQALFNMPGVAELEKNPENHQLGDQVEEAMFLNLVMLNSGTKDKMTDFLERPGAKFLIRKLAKEEEQRRQKVEGETFRYGEDEWKKEFIGDYESWTDDTEREPADRTTPEGVKITATFKTEFKDGKRGTVSYETIPDGTAPELKGTLTRWGNIPAFGGGPGEFGADMELKFIEGTVGKLVGSNEASWLAATMLRVIGAYASEGYVATPNGRSHLPLGEGRYISGDDTGKFWAYMFNYKEGMKGRPSGLKDMVGRIPDMAMNLFDWAQVRVEDVKDEKGNPEKRSVWDAWLGTAGQEKKNLFTGEPVEITDPSRFGEGIQAKAIDKRTGKLRDIVYEKVNQEPYHRLGDLNFKSLEREFHGTFSIMQWLMGNEKGPTGIFVDAMRVEGFRPEDFSLNELKKKVKYYQICLNPIILTKGSQHLYANVGESASKIQKNFLRNLMSARINSADFALNFLNSKRRIFNPDSSIGPAEYQISDAKIVELFINEALQDSPKDEKGIIEHYIDENKKIRELPSKTDDILSVLKGAKFEDNVGRVTGRKT